MEANRDAGGTESVERQAAIVEVMTRLAGGEQQAMWDLHALAEQPLARIVRVEARRIDFRLSDDDVLDITLDAAIELGRLAHAWHPDGAAPWVWARWRIIGLVHAHIGTFADPLDEQHLDLEMPAVPLPVEDVRGVLRTLAVHHPVAQQLELRLSEHASDRDADIWLEVQMERAGGNRSPAVTVAAVHDMRPDAVRKVMQRVAERISDPVGEVA